MSILYGPSRVLVPLELPDPEPLPERVVELLSSVTVILLGWFETPEQTPPEQAREGVDDDGSEALEKEAERLRSAGATVEVHHVFTPSLLATVERVGEEESCQAALLPEAGLGLDNLLVPVREATPAGRLARLVAEIAGDRNVTLLQLAEGGWDPEGDRPDWTQQLEEALVDAGVDPEKVERTTEATDEPAATVVEACRSGAYGLVVVAQPGPLEEGMFDDFPREILEEGGIPVLVLALPEA